MNTWSKNSKRAGVLAALCLSLNLLHAAPVKEGDDFPDLASAGLEGTLPDIKGKVVLVDFFASWCGPCKESFPAMEELHKKYSGQGLVILAINVDKKKTDMDGFLKEHPASFSIVRDASNKFVSAVKVPTMPSSFLLDRSGKVIAAHRGFHGAETAKQYSEQIETALK